MFGSLTKSALFAVVCLAISTNVALADPSTEWNVKRNEPAMIRRRHKVQEVARGIKAIDLGTQKHIAERALLDGEVDGVTALPLTLVGNALGGRSEGNSKRAAKDPKKKKARKTGMPLKLGMGVTAPVSFNGRKVCAYIEPSSVHGNVLPPKGSKRPYDIQKDPKAKPTGSKSLDGAEYAIASTIIGGVEAKNMTTAALPATKQWEDLDDSCAAVVGLSLPGGGNDKIEQGLKGPGFIEAAGSTLFSVTDGLLWMGGAPKGMDGKPVWMPSHSKTAWSVAGKIADEPFEAEFVWSAAATYVPTETAKRIFKKLGLKYEKSNENGGGDDILVAPVDCDKAAPLRMDLGGEDKTVVYTAEQTIWRRTDNSCVFVIVGSDNKNYAFASTIGYNMIAGLATIFDARDIKNPKIGLAGMIQPKK